MGARLPHALLFSALAWAPASPAVAATSCSAASGSEIQACIDGFGKKGGTVTIGQGTFVVSETIDLESNVTIEGAGKKKTTLRFTGGDKQDVLSGVGTSHVTIRDLRIHGTRRTDNYTCAEGEKICDGSKQALIIIKGNSSTGRIEDIVIDNVSVKYGHQYGIHIKRADEVDLIDVTARYNGTWRAEDHNIYLYNTSDVFIDGVSSQYSAGHGINIRDSDDVVVQDTMVKNNHHAGLRFGGESHRLLADGITAHDNSDNGIEFHAESEKDDQGRVIEFNPEQVCVQDSSLHSNLAAGVYFYFARQYERRSNSYSDNLGGSAVAVGSTQVSGICDQLNR
jgi:polygalacturonase